MRAARILATFALVAVSFGTLPAISVPVTEPKLADSIRHALGNMRGSYFMPDRRVSEQILMGLGGPPDPTVRLSGGSTLISACRQHSCDEKAAVIVSKTGQLVAAGLISFHCRHTVGARYPETCDNQSTLTLFLRRTKGREAYAQALRVWAARKSVAGQTETRTIPQVT